MAGRMYLGNQMVTPAIVSGGVDSVNGQTGEVVLDASDVNALPDTTKYAKTLGLSMNQTTFVLSWQLYDQNGDPIGQVQTVDLPLESVVVSGSYDSVNKKIVLTLQNGSTIDVPVGDLVAGLQSEITITNMLSSDLVDDTNRTHQFVTTQEKTTWNNKQNAINDLATIRAGASAGATAVQPSAIANMQTTTNLVTEVDDDSTDTQYPSAKAVYNVQLDLEGQLDDEARVRTRMDNQLSDRINNLSVLTNNKVNKCVRTTDVAPIVDYDLLNVPVQYKGTTTQDYVNGYFYKFTDPVYSSSVNVRVGSFTVAIDNPTFISRLGKAGLHLFKKYENYWLINYEDERYSLDYYGITITGTVNTGDEFVVDFSMTTTATRIDVQPSNAGTVTSVNNVHPVNGNVTLTASDVGALPDSTVIPTDTSDLTNGAGFITSSALSGYATQTWVGQQGYLTSTALSGYATEQWVGQQGYITGITSSMVATALGYTPYNGSVMTGADGTNAGTSGLVPAPAATDNTKYLRGDGTWQTVSSGSSEVEWATYGTTTYQQVKDWYDAGKIVYVKYAISGTFTRIFKLESVQDSTNKYFSFSCVQDKQNFMLTLNSSTGWSTNSRTYQESIPAGTAGQIVTYSGTAGTVGSATINDIVPTQSGNSGKFITTNGSAVSWGSALTTSDIVSSVSSSSDNTKAVGAKLFYDTCGDIETLINAL